MDMFFALATASASCSLGFFVNGFEEAIFACSWTVWLYVWREIISNESACGIRQKSVALLRRRRQKMATN